ncbi:tetratricopeptide (TPR) repeat protein [Flavobacterium sp. HSC-32F16]|uniref:tetratricopeptide repeat protein n=1 Tax=Flavobacterium sp. HSC-32F16 TaxID=2910964 RepID=UPI0020A3647A|nr:hypothetical protein [Flavobacterium sp. HSC-32F16]MCP2027260.1 tetratricopeptide (TPR) repeat protein [Flavobacterium sp. HSC-32F16]
MKLKFLLFFLTFSVYSFSQKLQRTVFDYEKLKSDNFAACDETVAKEQENISIKLQENNSTAAIAISKKLYDNKNDCFGTFEVYGYSLFRNGQWFEGIDIIEKGITKFGSVPELIKRKSEMSLEMAELGTRQKNIDGNSVFKADSLQYNEDQFKEENLKSALIDLEYLIKVYGRSEEIYYAAKIQQLLTNYTKSNETFKTLLNDEKYKNAALFNIADNYIALKDFTSAEAEFNKMLAENPKEAIIYDKLSEIYEFKKDKAKATELASKSMFYQNIPSDSDLEYSKENLELLQFFGSDENKPAKKLKKLQEILNQNKPQYTIDVCLMILKLHTNHGNGVEEKATEILKNIGKPSIEKVNKLFQSNVSTCTITNLADVMAGVKDENSWELMKQYLSYIATMPMTLIPPNLPEKMIQFNEDRGITEILTTVKPLLTKQENNEDPLSQLGGFGQYVYYSPLGKVSNEKLKKIAAELKYSDKEFSLLKDKIK